jgi:hypothetical protein
MSQREKSDKIQRELDLFFNNFESLSLSAGRRCATENCHRKPTNDGHYCSSCNADRKNQAETIKKTDSDENSRWSEAKVLDESRKVSDRLIKLVRENPSYRLYIGITTRGLQTRLNEHIKSGKDFDEAFVALEVPNAKSLADVEYHTIRNVSNELGSKHLDNRAAGGESR